MSDPTAAQNERMALVQSGLSKLLTETFDGVDAGEDGDGDRWFIAAIHSPDLPGGALLSCTSLGWGESMKAADLLGEAFDGQRQEYGNGLRVLGFSEAHATALVFAQSYNRHLRDDSPLLQAEKLLHELVCEDGLDELTAEQRAPIEKLLDRAADEAAMFQLAHASAEGQG